MALRTDVFDLSGLHLSTGEGRRLELHVNLDPLQLGGQVYAVKEELVPVVLDISRTTGDGYALRLRFRAELGGPCMRCLEPAAHGFDIDVREVSQPRRDGDDGADDDLVSPYVHAGALELEAWAHDSLALAVPAALLCRPDCAGLCPVCGTDLNQAGPRHAHEPEPDPRWAKLSELRFDT